MNNTTNTNTLYTPGTRVRVTEWGGGSYVATITHAYAQIKNDRPGYDLDNDRWCYHDQVTGKA